MNVDYDMACTEAAARQGLAEALDALLLAGLPASYEQTGGFCMVVAVYGEQDDYCWVTRSEEEPDRYLVCHYTDPDAPYSGAVEGERCLSNTATAGELAPLIRNAMNRRGS